MQTDKIATDLPTDRFSVRYPSGTVVQYERDTHGNLRVVDFEAGPMGGTSAHPVGVVQSPFTRRALAGTLPPKVTR